MNVDSFMFNHKILRSGFFHHALRAVHENNSSITATNLMYPVFVTSDPDSIQKIPSMPTVFRYGANCLIEHLKPLVDKGLSSVLLFGVIEENLKDDHGSCIDTSQNPVIEAVRLLRQSFPGLLIACDLCLCGYTSHGHCGVFKKDGTTVDTLKSVSRLAEAAVAYARAGCHIVAPSDMMDARVAAIKTALIENGFDSDVAILSYAAKFASKFYGPFRNAASSAPQAGDRKSYQLPPGSAGLASRAIKRDIEEGADMIMVKPGLPYLDIVKQSKQEHPEYPLFVYQVSGEYAMLYHAAAAGAFELKDAVLESIKSMRRAGADVIITYFTPQLLLEWL